MQLHHMSLVIAAVSALPAMAAAQEIRTGLHFAGSAVVDATGAPVSPTEGAVGLTRFSNVDNFSGTGLPHGAALVMDDVVMIEGPELLREVTISVANFGESTLSSVDAAIVHAPDPEVDGPADNLDDAVTLSASLDLAALLGGGGLPAEGVATITFTDLASQGVMLPESGSFDFMWAGLVFSNAAFTGAGQISDVGQGVFDPPTVGISGNLGFLQGFGLFDFGGDPIASFGLRFVVVPAPGGLGLVALGGIAVARRRR